MYREGQEVRLVVKVSNDWCAADNIVKALLEIRQTFQTHPNECILDNISNKFFLSFVYRLAFLNQVECKGLKPEAFYVL